MTLRFQRLQQTDFFSKLPLELALMVNENLTITDKLSLADTCRAHRPLITGAECIQACMMAGLSIPPHVTAREMAKLLCRPRVGVCNWSYEDGIPKGDPNNFSEVIPITYAIRENVSIALHPVFQAMNYMYLSKTSTFEMVHLRVAKNEPEILLCQHRLYTHEYVTSPPLDELHVMIKEDEGPLIDGYVTFRIRNPKGVTLGNYYQGLFRFLNAAPDPKMPLTEQILADVGAIFVNPRDSLDNGTNTSNGTNTTLYFDRNCPTNLDMLDIWYQVHQEDILFSEKAVTCSLPLYKGALTLVIYPDDPETVEDPDFIADCEYDIKWGEPQREPEVVFFPPVSDEELWADKAPLILF